MRIEYLEEFEMLATVLNFSKVAKSFHLSTSVLSRHISSLEREVGETLFERSTTLVELTPAGRQFFTKIVPVLDHYRQAMRDFANDPVRSKRQIKITLIRQSDVLKHTASRTAQKLEREKGIGVVYTLDSNPDPRDELNPLLDGRADAVVTYDSNRIPQGYCNVVLHTDPFTAIVPIEHPLACKKRISLVKDMAHHRTVILKSPMFRAGAAVLEDTFDAYGVTMQPTYLFAQSMDELCFSPPTEGVLITPLSAIPRHSYISPDTYVVLPFEEDLSFAVSLVYPQRNSSEALELFASALKEACERYVADAREAGGGHPAANTREAGGGRPAASMRSHASS